MKIVVKKKDKKRRNVLKDITINEVSSCGRGANEGARVTLLKADDEAFRSFNEILEGEKLDEKICELLRDGWQYMSSFRESAESILKDPGVTDKKQALREQLSAMMTAYLTMIDTADISFAKAFKTERGLQFPAGDYAYVPDAEKPSTWKLRLTSTPGGDPDPRIVGMAVAALGEGFRGNKVQIPAEDKGKVVARVRAAWLKANKDKDEGDLPAILKKSKSEETMNEQLEQLQKSVEELQGKLTKSEFLASLNDVEKAHYAGLTDDDKGAFEKMDATARKTAVETAVAKKAADDESLDVDGTLIKKSEVGPGVFAFMKAQQAKTAAAIAKAEKLESEAVQKSLEAEAEILWPNTAGTAADKALMLKSIRALPQEQQEAQMRMMKAADAAMSKGMSETGQSGAPESGSPVEKLNKMAETYSKEKNVSFEKAYSAVLGTKEGLDLYSESVK